VLRGILLAGVAAFTAANASGETLQCETQKSDKGGAPSGVEAKLGLSDGKIQSLRVSTFSPSDKEASGYACRLESAEGDGNSAWSYSADKTILELKDATGYRSTVTVTRKGKSYRIQLSQLSRSYCSFGAEWPTRINIREGRSKCEASLNSDRRTQYRPAHRHVTKYFVSIHGASKPSRTR
jgi:hypothetical protein